MLFFIFTQNHIRPFITGKKIVLCCRLKYRVKNIDGFEILDFSLSEWFLTKDINTGVSKILTRPNLAKNI